MITPDAFLVFLGAAWLEKSELWRRITATDPDDVMPPR